MTTINENAAIAKLNDMQKKIESFEEEWTKADKAGDREKTEILDRNIECFLAMRHGMEEMLSLLSIRFDRKDFRTVGLDGEWTVHTSWFLT